MTDYSRQVAEIGEYGPAANDNGAPGKSAKADPKPEPEPKAKAKAATTK